MPDKNSEINQELIAKYLAGEASAAEASAVENWISISELNQSEFSRLKLLWDECGFLVPPQVVPVNVDKAWERMKGRIADAPAPKQEQVGGKERNLYFYFSRIAAVFVIGMGLFYLFFFLQRSGDMVELAASDEVVSDTLSDGSITFLNRHSTLSFPTEFKGRDRTVHLKGEAFFKVVSKPEKPFKVNVEGAVIEVLGTSFFVKAYDTTSSVVVGVEEGRVKVSTGGSEVILNSGDEITIQLNDQTALFEQTDSFDPNDLSWKSNTLIFQDESLASVFQTLEEKYKVRIVVANPQILSCRLTAKLKLENLDQVLEIIQTNFKLNITNDGNQVMVSGAGCE